MLNKLWSIYTCTFVSTTFPFHHIGQIINSMQDLLYIWRWFWRAEKNSFIHLCVGTHAWYHLRNIISLNITTTDDLHNILTHKLHHIHNTRRGKLIWGWTLFYVLLLLLFQVILGGAGCCNLIEFMCIFCFLIATTSTTFMSVMLYMVV